MSIFVVNRIVNKFASLWETIIIGVWQKVPEMLFWQSNELMGWEVTPGGSQLGKNGE